MMKSANGLQGCIVLSYVVVLVMLIAGTATQPNPAAVTVAGPEEDQGGQNPQVEEPLAEGPSDPDPPPSEPPEEVVDCGQMPTFTDVEALAGYLSYIPNYTDMHRRLPMAGGPTMGGDIGLLDYSGTNNQVQGVDEADIVKTDGDFIYTAQNKTVTILQAYPPEEAAVVSRMTFHDAPVGLFVNGNWLVAITSGYAPDLDLARVTDILIYDISDRSSPILDRNYTVDGYYISSRMIGEYVYLVAQYMLYRYEDNEPILPSVWAPGGGYVLGPGDIGHFNDSRGSNGVLIVLAVRVTADEPVDFEAVLTGNTREVYVSAANVYVAGRTSIPLDNGTRSIAGTAIHKFRILYGDVHYICSGDVPGTVLDQYSMDEYKGNLRIATYRQDDPLGRGFTSTGVYVLDSLLKPLGRLEGLGAGENMHSARFVGDRGYLVTFQKIDPFFVINLTDPRAPAVLGYLKIPGFSDYMHPFDENHIIGLGKDTVEGQGGQFSWYQGVKVSLFDVTDVADPREDSKLVIGDRGSWSNAASDPKAFMFDPERGLLVLPIMLYEINRTQHPNPEPWLAGDFVWQGAYVLSVTLDNGIETLGRVSHLGDWASQRYNYWNSYYAIRRSLYIEDCLYTISPAVVQVNRLGTLAEVKRIQL